MNMKRVSLHKCFPLILSCLLIIIVYIQGGSAELILNNNQENFSNTPIQQNIIVYSLSEIPDIKSEQNNLSPFSQINSSILTINSLNRTISSPTITNTSHQVNISPLIPLAQVAPPDMNLDLKPGWNFVSTPAVLMPGKNTFEIFKNLDTGSRSLYRFDPSLGWMKLRGVDLFEPFDGIWIYSVKELTIPLYFDTKTTANPGVKFIKQGWNAIGLSMKNPLPISEALSSINENWFFLVPFNSTTQKSDAPIIKGWSGSYSNLLSPGEGYWLYMKSDGYLSGTLTQSDIPVSGTVDYTTKNEGGGYSLSLAR